MDYFLQTYHGVTGLAFWCLHLHAYRMKSNISFKVNYTTGPCGIELCHFSPRGIKFNKLILEVPFLKKNWSLC